MHACVIYDSNYGNTKEIAEIVAKELDGDAIPVGKVTDKDLEKADLLIVGSPINGWKPTVKIIEFLQSLGDHLLTGKKAASFDTRVKMFLHGDAAGRISRELKNAGATIIATPQGFIVSGTQGPLFDGETKKAELWAKSLKRVLQDGKTR